MSNHPKAISVIQNAITEPKKDKALDADELESLYGLMTFYHCTPTVRGGMKGSSTGP